MRSNSLFLALLLIGLTLAPRALPARGSVDDDAELAERFGRTVLTGSLADRREVLDALVALADHGQAEVLEAEFARVSIKLRGARDAAFRARYSLDRQRELLARMKLNAERDPSLEEYLEPQHERVAELAEELAGERETLADLDPWYDLLGEGTGRFFAALKPSKRKKIEGALWDAIEDEAADLPARLAAMEMLGFGGSDGTAVSLQDLIFDVCSESGKLKRKLPRLMVDVRKFELRMQREQEQNDGGMSRSLMEQYNRAKKEASDLQRRVTYLSFLADAAVSAGARGLAREEGKVQERSLSTLLRSQKKGRDGARQRILAMLGGVEDEGVRTRLREMIEGEEEPSARAAMIDALAAAGDVGLAELLLGGTLADESWHVRARAAAALARLRARDAVPILIERLEAEEGRVGTDIQGALRSLTGEDFGGNVELWRRWFAEHGDDFVVPELDELEARASEEARESIGMTFFGIRSDSRRVLFVLDLSGSMEFSMVPRNNPNDDPSKPYDRPRKGEISRLTAAKRAIVKALGGVEDGSVFNMIFYASDVWTWNDETVVMEPDTRSEAMRFCESLEAVGATNIYGALKVALEQAGATGGDEWSEPKIDTIFFLSDGRATVGLSTDADETLAFVREMNSNAGVVIHTIGLSGAQDAYLLRSLAEQNGGSYTSR